MYANDLATIEAALKLFADDDKGCHICSVLSVFGVQMRVECRKGADIVSDITQDIWNISTLLLRLEWMRGLAVRGQLDPDNWKAFSRLDIENLFVQVRSSMDHAAELIQVQLPKKGQLPNSFNKLRTSIGKYGERLPHELRELIESARWFEQMRGIRDALVHQGGMSLVFGEPAEPLLFQVYGRGTNGYAFHPALMINGNIVHFERYVALLVANLLTFLDSLGGVLRAINPASMKLGQVRSYSSGFALLRDWMIQTRHSLAQTASP